MKVYLDLVRRILKDGEWKENRTDMPALTVAGASVEHDMSKGFPMLTTKKLPFKSIKTEMEFFIKGLTDKKWLQDRGCTIWNEWCSPDIVPYGKDEETKKRMASERDLGPIYGWQWRHLGAEYSGYDQDYSGQGIDQLAKVVDELKKNPNDRRMIVNAWNPKDLHRMALPPCHYAFQVTVINGKLNLSWNQRSVDTMLGLPFNIAGYGLLLHLLAKEAKLQEGKLIGQLVDTHIYQNHLDGAYVQLSRSPDDHDLPKIQTDNFTSIFDWSANDTKLINYQAHPSIKMDISV